MKKLTVKGRFPMNYKEDNEAVFSGKIDYQYTPSRIKKLKHVFVSHEGLVLKNGMLVDRCALNLKGKDDNTFYYPFWRNLVEQYAVSKWGKSLPSIHLNKPQKYLLIHSKWFNYAFWITDYLPRLIMVEENFLLEKTVLIFPESWKSIDYVQESLSSFDIKTKEIPSGTHLFIDELVMPETRKWSFSFDPKQVKKVRERMVPYALMITAGKPFPQKIYVTRKKRGTRCVENEENILPILKRAGYSVIDFEDFSFWEQVAMMHGASHFVSLHGAGFANIIFMQTKNIVLELINKTYAENEYKMQYWRLSNACGLNYLYQLCEPLNKVSKLKFGKSNEENENDFLVNQNVVIDLKVLQNNLTIMNL
jgi:hypothetical protein